jgi:F0F1-type ATP synthase membrane subunit b/b'
MAERSDEIRSEIERTREQMGETVEALEYKANVPARAKGWVADKKDAVVSSVSGAKDTVADAAPDGQAVKQRAGAMRGTAEQNPVGLVIAGAAVGFLAGMLVPSTRIEDERVGPMADEVKSSATDAASEALDRGKQVAQEAAQSAVETAKEEGQRHGEELTESLQERARDTASSVAESGSQ